MSSHLIHYVFFCLFVQKNHFFVANLILTLLTPKIQFKILLRMAPLLSWNIQNKIQCFINLHHISHFTFGSEVKIRFASTLPCHGFCWIYFVIILYAFWQIFAAIQYNLYCSRAHINTEISHHCYSISNSKLCSKSIFTKIIELNWVFSTSLEQMNYCLFPFFLLLNLLNW